MDKDGFAVPMPVDREAVAELEEEVVGKGVGKALKIFRERGMLGKSTALGRNKDKSLEQQLRAFGDTKNQEDDRVKLEYFDKKGKKLTLKEAFRQMCWKFHGTMPSHRKQEKRRDKEQLEQKQMQKMASQSVGITGGAQSGARKLGSLGTG